MIRNKSKVALIFDYSESWIGGTYYILNLISALNDHIEDSLKPELIILSNEKDFNYLISQVDYPYLTFVRLDENPKHKALKFINRVTQKLFKKKLIKRRLKIDIQAVFPFRNSNFLNNISAGKRIYWIPDFQEKHYPDFYTKEHLERELLVNSNIVLNSKKLLLSSQDAKNDLEQFYPNYKTRPFVVHFAVKVPDKSKIEQEELLLKFRLPKLFYFAPNQFWKHKNQLIIIKAIEILKRQGVEAVVAFSGKENDPRSPHYTQELKEYVVNAGLSENIKFLGFIERSEQLKLMEICRAVIQPSLFEGWSTVIEEAMAFGKLVIASDIDVNKEQLMGNGIYFNRNNPEDLANKLLRIEELPASINYSYAQKQKQFARDFLKCVNA